MTKILISVDIEGISGIANGRELWLREAVTADTNAAIEGVKEDTQLEEGGVSKDGVSLLGPHRSQDLSSV